MLLQFSVENFRSFNEAATLSLVASKRRAKNKSLDVGAVFEAPSDLKVLKCSTVYGANGSGKSNIVKALSFMRFFVLNSSKDSAVDDPIPVTPHAFRTENITKPSIFDISFLHNGDIYQYGFSATPSCIIDEWLVYREEGSSKDIELFDRKYNEISMAESFKEEGQSLVSKTRNNSLFLSVCANFNGPVSTVVTRWFQKLRIMSGLNDLGLMQGAKKFLLTNNTDSFKQILSNFDLGFSNIKAIEETDSNNFEPPIPELAALFSELKKITQLSKNSVTRIKTEHPIYDKNNIEVGKAELDLEQDESEGTRKLVALTAPLLDALKEPVTLVIDEFDARVHPIISKQIIEIFNCKNRNPNNAQLVAITHDTNLLDNELLRRDQVWFMEKDQFGASHLTSLVEFKVRNDASFEKDYILGRYGAIPFIGNGFMELPKK